MRAQLVTRAGLLQRHAGDAPASGLGHIDRAKGAEERPKAKVDDAHPRGGEEAETLSNAQQEVIHLVHRDEGNLYMHIQVGVSFIELSTRQQVPSMVEAIDEKLLKWRIGLSS